MGFEEVRLEEALSDPAGFYAQYARIQRADRRLLLIRFPREFDLNSLEGKSLSFSTDSGPLGLHEGQYTLQTMREPTMMAVAPLALAVPGHKALLVEPLEEPLWTVAKRPNHSLEGAENDETIDFDKDLGGRTFPPVTTNKRRQPEGLRMNLSAIDISTVINRKRRKASSKGDK